MASSLNSHQPHFVLVPLFAQGHMIPMIDIARVLAERGVLVTLLTTPHNAARFEHTIHRASQSGLPIHLLNIPFPCQQVGLPLGCENLYVLPSRSLLRKFYNALDLLQRPLEEYLQTQSTHPPSCIISDKCLSWTSLTAQKFHIPRLVFHGMCCFSLLCSYNIMLHNAHLSVSSDLEPFLIPGLLQSIEITKAQLPGAFVAQPDLDDFRDKMKEAEMSSYGVVVNSFEELEHGYAMEYEKAMNKKVWCIGPLSLCNKESLDKFERGNMPSIEEKYCSEWLDMKKPRSVLYVCLGSLCRLLPSQLIELGLALESSQRPFIWVLKTTGEDNAEIEKWLDEGFEKRIEGRGLLIKGWAPQILILSHPSIGGFLTHCGWNSTLEGVCSGVPLMTWPLFAEQFVNEKLVVEVLKIGVRVGVEVPVRWGDEGKVGVLVKKDRIKEAIEMCMEGGEEGENRRNRAIELGKMAKRVVHEQGSSHSNVSHLIQDVMQQLKCMVS